MDISQPETEKTPVSDILAQTRQAEDTARETRAHLPDVAALFRLHGRLHVDAAVARQRAVSPLERHLAARDKPVPQSRCDAHTVSIQNTLELRECGFAAQSGRIAASCAVMVTV
jgi:hypothetical protein